jgi:hypothetical protein
MINVQSTDAKISPPKRQASTSRSAVAPFFDIDHDLHKAICDFCDKPFACYDKKGTTSVLFMYNNNNRTFNGQHRFYFQICMKRSNHLERVQKAPERHSFKGGAHCCIWAFCRVEKTSHPTAGLNNFFVKLVSPSTVSTYNSANTCPFN